MVYAKNTDNQPITRYKPVERCLNFKAKHEYTIPVIARYQVIARSATESGNLTVKSSTGVYVPAISIKIALWSTFLNTFLAVSLTIA